MRKSTFDESTISSLSGKYIYRFIFVFSQATGNALMKKAGEKRQRVKYLANAVSNLEKESKLKK